MPSEKICTTHRAAELLGISVTTVQQLVESGALGGWKTKGGHRRIPLAAVTAYQCLQEPATVRELSAPVILVVEDNPIQRALYQHWLATWQLGATLHFCDNGYQALLAIAHLRPDVVLADIAMEGIDGFAVIRAVLDDPKLRHTQIAILSQLPEAELAARGGVPPGVVFLPKPVNGDELRGYLRACCADVARRGAHG